MNSIVIATYNGEKYIAQQLHSILKQIAKEDEVIVSDDGSKDNTVAIVEQIQDHRIHILHSKTHSCKWNFVYALSQAKGEIIFLSDQDDIWLEGKYERCLKELEDVDLVCTNSQLCDENLNVLIPSFFSVYKSGRGIFKNAINNTYYGACMAFHRRVYELACPFPTTKEIGHDIWLGLVGEMVGKTRFIDTPYLLYRRHAQTVTQTEALWTRSKRRLWQKIWSRFVVLYNVTEYWLKHRKKALKRKGNNTLS